MTDSSLQQVRLKRPSPELTQLLTQSTGPGLLVLLSVMTVTACGTTRTTVTDSVPCAALEPIRFSASGDTPETIRGVREYNAVLAEVCD